MPHMDKDERPFIAMQSIQSTSPPGTDFLINDKVLEEYLEAVSNAKKKIRVIAWELEKNKLNRGELEIVKQLKI
ncbi:hypothetical protein Moror_14882 [Moniliophthora roreri MCA 2997]|uniref:Uncharacterized protein n=1 Tax=Moniliophthora roreri (strain MCA 2997) TaxID=1381753 RepID=V2XNX5_MONRO|nr:hypothetical protein Moror_14882 [Moniliophthora roreri MCA 2997]